VKGDHESYAKQLIESVRGFDRCNWCGREARKNRKGLCRPCDRVLNNLEAVEKHIREHPPKSRDFMLDWELRVAREMKNDCIAWGQMLKNILAGPVDSLSLEHWFGKIAGTVARDEKMYHGMANVLGAVFSAEQRQVLSYLLWKVFATEASHTRFKRAMARAQRESMKTG